MNNYIEEDVLTDAYREEVKKEKMEAIYKEDIIEELYGERGED